MQLYLYDNNINMYTNYNVQFNYIITIIGVFDTLLSQL